MFIHLVNIVTSENSHVTKITYLYIYNTCNLVDIVTSDISHVTK